MEQNTFLGSGSSHDFGRFLMGMRRPAQTREQIVSRGEQRLPIVRKKRSRAEQVTDIVVRSVLSQDPSSWSTHSRTNCSLYRTL